MRIVALSGLLLAVAAASVWPVTTSAQDVDPTMIPAPDRGADEGEGPFDRLIIRGATLIDGTGAPPIGPVDIVIEGNRIVDVDSVGYPGLPIDEDERPKDATREIDAHGSYVMPGLIDVHTHTGGETKAPRAEYSYKLWMGHGITTIRGVPSGSFEFSVAEKARSANNEIVAPRIFAYQRPGSGERYEDRKILTPQDATEWVQYAARAGADGLKLGAYRPAIMRALIDEAKKSGPRHDGSPGTIRRRADERTGRRRARTRTRSRTTTACLRRCTKNHDVQPWPADMNYNNEQHRFGQVARQWNLIAGRGSTMERGFAGIPGAGLYARSDIYAFIRGRDVMRARNADWHAVYTLPTQWDFYTPNRESHGAYWFDWTTADEICVEELLSRVDAVRERLQEPRWPRDGRF